MVERMSSADAAPLLRERSTAPAHVGGIAVFAAPAGGFDYDRLVRLVEERIPLAPRYRQRVRTVPGNLSTPIWVDDPHFDITYHVRRSALPRPGSDDQLLEFCARIQGRLLDRNRPLWEMYLVEGLSGNRIAILTKTHEAMVDEEGGIDLSQVILDAAPEPRRTVSPIWMPEPEPSTAEVLRDAALDVLRHPLGLTDTARATARATAREAQRSLSRVSRVLDAARAAGALVHRGERLPLQVEPSEQRRLAVARTTLGDYRRVRSAFGGSVNDVVLAVVTGALRGWLLSRGEQLSAATTIRALVPLSVAVTGEDNQVRPFLLDLPVGEADPVLRLTQLRYAMSAHMTSGRAVSAETLATLHGFAPPTLSALAARAAAGLTRRMFSLVVTNVPGPQQPLYAAGVPMTEMFPIMPLPRGQAVSIALTSYDGGVFFGINGDRGAVRDIGVLAELIEESLAELLARAESPVRVHHEGIDHP